MEVTIKINSCIECQHSSHTGAFTKGGSKPCCNHPDTCRAKGDSCFDRVIPYRTEFRTMAAGISCREYETHEPKGIPAWCPLKHGGKY